MLSSDVGMYSFQTVVYWQIFKYDCDFIVKCSQCWPLVRSHVKSVLSRHLHYSPSGFAPSETIRKRPTRYTSALNSSTVPTDYPQQCCWCFQYSCCFFHSFPPVLAEFHPIYTCLVDSTFIVPKQRCSRAWHLPVSLAPTLLCQTQLDHTFSLAICILYCS